MHKIMCWEMCYEILDYELKIYQIKTSPPAPAPPLLWCTWAKFSKENLLLKRNIIDTWSFVLGLTTSLEQIYLKLYLVYYLLNIYLMFFFFLRVYSGWYCARPGVRVLASRISLALNRCWNFWWIIWFSWW